MMMNRISQNLGDLNFLINAARPAGAPKVTGRPVFHRDYDCRGWMVAGWMIGAPCLDRPEAPANHIAVFWDSIQDGMSHEIFNDGRESHYNQRDVAE